MKYGATGRYLGPSFADIADPAEREAVRQAIIAIAKRAERDFGASRLATTMDVLCVHTNDTPLDLTRLLAADAFNFAHDVCGIGKHLDRNAGKLTNCFSPRFAKRDLAAA